MCAASNDLDGIVGKGRINREFLHVRSLSAWLDCVVRTGRQHGIYFKRETQQSAGPLPCQVVVESYETMVMSVARKCSILWELAAMYYYE